jgi:RND family efflux transporter MFP subunit
MMAKDWEGRIEYGGQLDSGVDVMLGVATEDDFPHLGALDFVDSHVDPETGTIQVRAIFPNTDINLVPGMFSKIRIPIGLLDDALLVPELATAQDQQGHYLLVVNEANVVERRSVTLGPKKKDLIVVLEGIQPGDRIVVNGLLNARPGSEVTVELSEVESAFPSTAPSVDQSEVKILAEAPAESAG